MQLYVNMAATTSRAVLAFCHAAGVALEIKHVDILRGEQHAPAFAALNPNRLVPVLVDDGFVLTESSAILRYLACRSRSPLYPDDLQTRARIDERMAWFEANFFKDFGYQYVYPQLLPHHARSSPEGTRSAIEWGRVKSRAWLQVLDEHLLGGSGWLVGGALSIADFFCASILSLGELVGCRLDDYPNVQRWYAQVTELPSWRDVNGTFRDFAGSLRVGEFVRL
ncbi:MAG TPA: glutathione S-transferase family protein [Polyangiales bacterium]|nr:glutathione S-transferase family protein [Polyangiales bacterium]